MEENLPKISKKPKNSPLRALSGMSLPNIERESAWMPPWLVAQSTASIQNCHKLFIKYAKMQINMYTQMPTPTMVRAPNLAASLHLAAADAAEERSSGAWHTEWDTLRILLQRTAVAAAQTDVLLNGLRVHTDQMRANVDSAAQALASEQNSMAALAGRAPAGRPGTGRQTLRATMRKTG